MDAAMRKRGAGVDMSDNGNGVLSEVLDLTGFTVADLRGQDGWPLARSGRRLLRQVYRARGNFGPADPPMASVD
jgi:hypothetical protein